MRVDFRAQEPLQKRILLGHRRRKPCKSARLATNILNRSHATSIDGPLRVFDQVGRKTVKNALQRLVKRELRRALGMRAHYGFPRLPEYRDIASERLQIEQSRLKSIVQIGRVVRNLVHPIDQLRLERRPLIEQIFRELRELFRRIVPRMLHNPLANLKREIQPGEIKIALLKLLHDSQRVQIMIEISGMLPHPRIEPAFACMPKWRMPNIVNERQRLG